MQSWRPKFLYFFYVGFATCDLLVISGCLPLCTVCRALRSTLRMHGIRDLSFPE